MRPIDADAFSEQYGNYYAEQGPAEGFIGTVGELIAKQPTIEPEVRHGKWNEMYHYIENGIEMADYECTNCGGEITKQRGDTPKYCEHCGAVMREEGADNGD